MSMMKRYCEEVSVDMGLDGEITDEVMAEAQARLDAGLTATCKQEPPGHAARRLVIVDELLAACKEVDEKTAAIMGKLFGMFLVDASTEQAIDDANAIRIILNDLANSALAAIAKATPATDPATDAETVAETQVSQVESDNA